MPQYEKIKEGKDEDIRAPNLLFCGYFMLKRLIFLLYFKSFMNNVYLPI